jgi:hypothetical protein
MPDINSLVKRFDKLKQRRTQWEPFFRDVRDYIRPRKAKVDSSVFQYGQPSTNKRFDSTATEANRLLALSMQNSLCPSSVIWYKLKIPEAHPMAELNDDPEVQAWFNAAMEKMFYTMHTSNFYSVIGEAFLDYTSFGTICVMVDEDDLTHPNFNGIIYKSMPIGEFVFAEDRRGVPDTLFWEYRMSARQAAQQFGKNNLPEAIREALEAKPDEEYDFLRAVIPAEDYYSKKKRGKEKMAWTSLDISMDGKEKIAESGYHEFPYAIGRFAKESGELWGRSPADVAMADIKVLNKIRELELRALNKAVDPPLIAPHQGIVGAFKLIPGAINYSREPERIKFLPFEGRFDLTNLKGDELKRGIRSMFMADQLVMPEKPNMTAQEVIELREQFQRMLGPTVARFESEVLMPIVLRTFGIGYRTGLFPPPPEAMYGLNEIDVEFVGSLAKAQKISDVSAITQWFGMVGQAAQFSPDIIDIVDFEESLRILGDRLSVPGEALRSAEELMQRRTIKAEQAQEQKLTSELMQAAEGIGKAGPGIKALTEANETTEGVEAAPAG